MQSRDLKLMNAIIYVWITVSCFYSLNKYRGWYLPMGSILEKADTCAQVTVLTGCADDLRLRFKMKVRAIRLGGESIDNWCVIFS